MTLAIEAPTDAQLDVIRAMCRERGVPLPDVIYSKMEARRIFDELKAGTYDPERLPPRRRPARGAAAMTFAYVVLGAFIGAGLAELGWYLAVRKGRR